jgi:hypothetical protein
MREVDNENSEENSYIITNIFPIAIKHFDFPFTSLLEEPRMKLNKSIWSILINNNLIKKSNAKAVDYNISPFSEGLNRIYKKIVDDDNLRPIMQGIEFKDGNATGTDAHKLLHLVGDNSNRSYFKKNGVFSLYSNIEKIYNSLKKNNSIDISMNEYYEKVGEIEGYYPNWIRVVPKDYLFFKTFDLDYLNSVLLTIYKNKLTNPTTKAIAFEFDTTNGKYHIGFNAELLSEICESMIMAGENLVNFYFNEPSQGIFILNKDYEFPYSNEFNNFGLCMPVKLYTFEDSIYKDLLNYPLIKYNDVYDFDIKIGDSPSYNLIQGGNKSNQKEEKKSDKKSYKDIINGYELAIEVETDSKKIKLYQDIIEGYKIAMEI